MFWIKVLFVFGIAVTFYSYIGYGLLLWSWLKLRRLIKPATPETRTTVFTPPVTLVIAAYNEEDIILQKIENSLALDYPKSVLNLIFITDGSTDRTPAIVQLYPQIQHLHSDARQGKV